MAFKEFSKFLGVFFNTKSNRDITAELKSLFVFAQSLLQEALPHQHCDFQQSRPPRPQVVDSYFKNRLWFYEKPNVLVNVTAHCL